MAINPRIIVGGIAAAAVIITIIVLAVTLGRSTSDNTDGNNCEMFEETIIVSISARPDGIVLTWIHPLPECDIIFTIEYNIDGGEMQSVSTAETSVTLPRPNACSTLSFNLRAENIVGEPNISTIGNYSVMPAEGIVSNVEFFYDEAGLKVTWDRPEGLENCNLNYVVLYQDDLGEDSLKEKIETSSEYVIIPDDMHCLQLTVYIDTYVFGLQIPGASLETTFIDRVRDIDIQQINFHEMIVTWAERPRSEECLLTHSVQLTLDGDTVEEDIQTDNATAILPIILCTPFGVVVRSERALTDTTSMPTVFVKTLDPIALLPVQDASIVVIGDNSGTIAWNAPEYASKCTNLAYIVHAMNVETEAEAWCIGRGMCSLSLDSFCPRTIIRIREVSGIMQEVSFDYYCS